MSTRSISTIDRAGVFKVTALLKAALSKGRGTMLGWLTMTDSTALESRMLAEIEKGKHADLERTTERVKPFEIGL